MGKKLKSMFSKQEPIEMLNLYFNNPGDFQAIKNKMDKLVKEGEGFDLPVHGKAEKSKQIGKNNFTVMQKEVERISVSPIKNEKEKELNIDGKKKIIRYDITSVENGFRINASFEQLLQIKFIITSDDLKKSDGEAHVLFQWDYKNEDAPNVDTSILAFKEAQQFLKSIINDENLEKDKYSVYHLFDHCANILSCYRSVIKELKLEDRVKELDLSDSSIIKSIYYLYFLLVEKKPIREDRKMEKFSETERIDDQKKKELIGKDYLVSGLQTISYNFMGDVFNIHLSFLHFNLVIEKIENDPQKNECKIYVKDTDEKPMFVSYKGFFTEIDAQKELKNAKTDLDEYYNALTLNRYVIEQFD